MRKDDSKFLLKFITLRLWLIYQIGLLVTMIVNGQGVKGEEPSDSDCTLVNPKTHAIINLNRLTQSTGMDYSVTDEQTGDIFKINVCRAVMEEVWGVEDASSIGIYRKIGIKKGESLGSWNKTLIPHGDSASVVYDNGSPCKSNPSVRMSSIIAFECAPEVWHSGNPTFAGSIDGCQFFFTWRTPLACGSLVQRSLWHSFQVVLVGLMLIFGIYYILFFSYRRFHLNLRGRDQFPKTPSLNGLKRLPILEPVIKKIEEVIFKVFKIRSSSLTNPSNRRFDNNNDSVNNWTHESSTRIWWEGEDEDEDDFQEGNLAQKSWGSNRNLNSSGRSKKLVDEQNQRKNYERINNNENSRMISEQELSENFKEPNRSKNSWSSYFPYNRSNSVNNFYDDDAGNEGGHQNYNSNNINNFHFNYNNRNSGGNSIDISPTLLPTIIRTDVDNQTHHELT